MKMFAETAGWQLAIACGALLAIELFGESSPLPNF